MKKGKVFIIAEAGVNHNGNLRIAKKMIDVAKNSGADAIKFQTFRGEDLISKNAPKAEYQKRFTGDNESHLEMIKKFELSIEDHQKLMKYCKEKNIIFISSPFDIESVDLLCRLGLKIFKIPSGEITNLPYLKKIGALRKKVIVSTGMSNLKEVKAAIRVLVHEGTKKKDITILHCNTQYPTPYEDVNLRAMITLQNAFNVRVGYSDHTLGIEVPIAAVTLGATVIEKHFTLDKGMPGPDHQASLEPHELRSMIIAIRNIKTAIGDGIKKVSPSEISNRPIIRKSIFASKDIKKGGLFTEENITVKRPGYGISPMKWDNVIGKVAKRDFAKDENIEL